MSDRSLIQWRDETWDPIRDRPRHATSCWRCHAGGTAGHSAARVGAAWRWAANEVVLIVEELDIPLRWRKPRRVLVNSVFDMFHEAIPDENIARVFEVMARAPRHVFQIQTKHIDRLAALAPRLPWPPNVWLLRDPECADPSEWPEDLRVREWPA